MSSSGQIQAICRIERRFPCDLIHNGHTHVRHTLSNPVYRTCLRHVRRLGEGITEQQVETIVRFHKALA